MIRDEIEKGLRTELTFSVEDTEYWEIGNHFALKGKAITKLLDYLHSKGVVLSVERECPGISPAVECATKLGVFHKTQVDMLDAGFKATIPLIGEIDG